MALISDTHKFVFIHIYKTGGTSIQSALASYRRKEHGKRRKHVTIRRLLTEGYREMLANYHVFTVVRNPFDRMVSIYFYHQQREGKGEGTKQGFARYVEEYDAIHRNPHWRKNQYEWISDNGQMCVDTILRFETLAKDFAQLCEKLKLSAKLPHTNKSRHRPYREYYTPELRRIIEKRFRCDLEQFNYSF